MALLGVQDLQDSTSRCPESPGWSFLCVLCLPAQSKGHGGHPSRRSQQEIPADWQSRDDWELLAGQGSKRASIMTSQNPENRKNDLLRITGVPGL